MVCTEKCGSFTPTNIALRASLERVLKVNRPSGLLINQIHSRGINIRSLPRVRLTKSLKSCAMYGSCLYYSSDIICYLRVLHINSIICRFHIHIRRWPNSRIAVNWGSRCIIFIMYIMYICVVWHCVIIRRLICRNSATSSSLSSWSLSSDSPAVRG